MINSFQVAWIVLNYDCNNSCKWCYASSNYHLSKRPILPKEKISPLLGLIQGLKLKRTILIGGEPSIYPFLFEVLEEHKSRGINYGMVTNGRRFSDRNFTKKVHSLGLNEITVSIEGDNSQTHDSLTRVNGSYDESISGIELANSEGIKVSTNTVVSRLNIGNLEKIVESLLLYPLKSISFNICGPCLGAEENNSEIIPPLLVAKEFQKIYLKYKNCGKKIKLVTPVPLCYFDSSLRNQLLQDKAISGGPCQLAHGKNFVVDPNGGVLPCTHLTGFSLFNLFDEQGVISPEIFLEKYNSPEEEPGQFRKMMQRNPSKKCDEPSCYEPCSGGCPLFWKIFDPQKEIKGA